MTPRCPYCLDDIHLDEEPVRCAKCRTPHHAACFQENQVCVAYGCLSRDEVPAGLSLFKKPLITVHHQPTREEALGPFALGWKALPSVPEQRPPRRCPPSYARMSLEGRELREGDALRGRAVIYTPTPLEFKRVDLCLLQGIARPEHVDRVTLGDCESLRRHDGVLPVGSHPFYLEIQAPPTTGPVDPFLFEVVLVRGLLRTPREVRSLPMHLFLLEQRHAPPQRVARPLDVRPMPTRVAAREHELPPGGDQPVAVPAAGPGPMAGEGAQGVLAAAPGWSPAVDGDWTELRVASPSGIFTSDQQTDRTIAARFCQAPPGGADVALHVPAFLEAPEFRARICGGGELRALSVAVNYELVRPGGAEVTAPGFPATEEARVLGAGALDPARYGDGGVELRVRVPRQRLQALARARQGGAHNAALRLRVGLDAIDVRGRVVSCPTRTATYMAPT